MDVSASHNLSEEWDFIGIRQSLSKCRTPVFSAGQCPSFNPQSPANSFPDTSPSCEQLRETKELHANSEDKREPGPLWESAAAPHFRPQQAQSYWIDQDLVVQVKEKVFGDLWAVLIFYSPSSKGNEFHYVPKAKKADIFFPHVLIPHEPQDCTKLTLGPSGPTGPGMPGTPGEPGLPFKSEQQKSGRLGLFPSFQEMRFVWWAQRELWGP